jgi:ABC-2 type transport system ATP-binding protein
VVAGIDATEHPERIRRITGLAGQFAAVDATMTGRENLLVVGRLYGLTRAEAAANAEQVLHQLGLEGVADRRVATYSGGLRRRIDLGASLVGRPRLLLLDEPTTGLDPRSRNHLWEAIRQMVEHGTDVLLTTQDLDEADQLAQRVVIIDHGRAIAQGTPGELKALAGRDMVEVRGHGPADLEALSRALAPIGSGEPRVDATTNRVTVPVTDGTAALAAAAQRLGTLAVEVDDIALRRPTLDEVFLTLTGAPAAPGSDGQEEAS